MICSSVYLFCFIVGAFPQGPVSSSPWINSRGQRHSQRSDGRPASRICSARVWIRSSICRRAGEVGASDRLAFPGREVWHGLHGQAGSSAAADASDGWACRPQAHARPLRRGVVRALGREPVLPVFLRRRVLPAPAGVRPLLADTLAPAHGGGEARCSAAGERGLGPPAPRGVSRPIWPASLSTPPFSPRQ